MTSVGESTDMKKSIRQVLNLTACLMFSSSVLGGSWTDFTQVDTLESYGAGVVVWGENFGINPAGCADSRAATLTAMGAGESRQLVAMLLAATLSRYRVSLKLRDECAASGDMVFYAVKVTAN